jgi:hypothetical protein
LYSGIIARAMMKSCEQISRELVSKECEKHSLKENVNLFPIPCLSNINPSEILIEAYERVRKSGEVEAGSTTVCLVGLRPLTK